MTYEYFAKIVDVYDGDTFTFEVDLGFSIKVKEKMRLARINTPEVRGAEKVFGKEVRDHVKMLIEGKIVKIKVYKKGKFGRYVADVWFHEDLHLGGLPHDGRIVDASGINLTDYLIERGMGKEFMADDL